MGKRARRSGSAFGENIGAKVPASHLEIGRALYTGPPLGIDQSPPLQPIPDQLLTRRAATEAAHPFSEPNLAASDVHRAFQGGDMRRVVSLDLERLRHMARSYTTTVVKGNTLGCMTNNNSGCTVTPLPVRRPGDARLNATVRKPKQAKPSAKKKAAPGADGRTLGQRLELAMRHRAGVLGVEQYIQIQLWRDANRIAGGTESAPAFSQQAVSKILSGETTRSEITPFLADACGISSSWLASGLGQMLSHR